MTIREETKRGWKYRLTHLTWWVYLLIIPLFYLLYWLWRGSGSSN
jgi:hypothetical protein